MLERDGIFIAEGEKVVKSLIESNCKIASCLAAGDLLAKYKSILRSALKKGAHAYIASNRLIEEIIGFRFHKGIMAVGLCPKKERASGVVKKLKKPLFLMALEAVNDPQNVGLIVRNAAAFGVQALIIDGETYDPYYRKAVRVSMGSIFDLPVCYEEDLSSSLTRIREEYGVRIVVATPKKWSVDISKADLSGNICVVLGNEDKGVSRGTLSIADERVRIPISRTIDSLNVASAGAVFLYEASRSRRS